MKWFLRTYTSRFNHRHKLFGHLFSGLYKSLLVEERSRRDEPGDWKGGGWCLGDEEFRQELLAQMESKLGRHHGGAERQETATARAERILAAELQRRGWAAEQLAGRRKGDREKVKMARRLRGGTTTCLPAGR